MKGQAFQKWHRSIFLSGIEDAREHGNVSAVACACVLRRERHESELIDANKRTQFDLREATLKIALI